MANGYKNLMNSKPEKDKKLRKKYKEVPISEEEVAENIEGGKKRQPKQAPRVTDTSMVEGSERKRVGPKKNPYMETRTAHVEGAGESPMKVMPIYDNPAGGYKPGVPEEQKDVPKSTRTSAGTKEEWEVQYEGGKKKRLSDEAFKKLMKAQGKTHYKQFEEDYNKRYTKKP